MTAEQAFQERIFDRLAAMSSEASRIKFITRLRLMSRLTVQRLGEAVVAHVRIDLKKADRLADAAVAIADKLADNESQGYALRAKANALAYQGQNRQASELFTRAGGLFEDAGKTVEAGRTLSTSIQPLILLGEYETALRAAGRARQIFAAAGETVRLARLEINVGNIFHRQDRFREALECYQQAYAQLFPDKNTEGIVAALHNVAVCLTMLNEYEKALDAYERVSKICQERHMPLAMAQADYNIAYLYYLRGQYGRAIEMLRVARRTCLKVGDPYHLALTQLDLSEIYLELNFIQEAGELAQEAYASFEKLGMGYEAAKALCQSAIALSQQGKIFKSLASFTQARTMFVKEKNQTWPSLIDLYQALAYFNDGRLEESRRYCLAALHFFRDSPLPGKAVLCRLLLARVSLKSGEIVAARQECHTALSELTGKETPLLVYQANLVMGQVEEAAGELAAAERHYRNAREVLETLRGGLYGDELKISFLENKLEVYENLVELSLARGPEPEAKQEAWTCMEQAKSRSLLELIVRGVNSGAPERPRETGLTLRIVNLREQLNWYYHRIEVEQLAQVPASDQRLLELRGLAAQSEREFLRLVRELPAQAAGAAGMNETRPVSLAAVREALGPNATMVEYFRSRNRILAAIITEKDLHIIPVTESARIAEILHMLQFQFAKFRLGANYVQQFHELLLDSVRARLHELYQELLCGVRDKLHGSHLVIVPHESLHCVPFHAFFDGERYLADSFAVSYAPSASIYVQCRQKRANREGSSLILGVPSPQAPCIYEELQSVAAILPRAKLFLGANASERVLREEGQQSRLIHIATHGFFRQDSPMFSGIRLGDTFLTLYDLYRLALPADQITLSGCSTGQTVIAAGDEVIGLMRGLLFAGARSLLLSLWDVNDRSTAAFMNAFYRRFLNQPDRALAFQGAVQELRESYPHPYYWAPFILVGGAAA
jgi:CHAT domain-containing protein